MARRKATADATPPLPPPAVNTDQPTRKRGRPCKEVLPNDNSGPAPRRSGRSVTSKNAANKNSQLEDLANESDIPPAKKAKKASGQGTQPKAVPTRARATGRAATAAFTREPLPEREGRNTHPGKQPGVAPMARRTPAEVAEQRREDESRAQETLQRDQEARMTVAQWDVDEEEEEERMDQESTTRLSARLKKAYQDRASDEESFDFEGIDDTDEEPEMTKTKAQKKAKKAIRGDIESIADELRGGGGGGGNGKKSYTRFEKSDLQPKKYKNGGIRSPVKASQQKKVIGGLDDSDIEERRPDFPAPTKSFVKPQIPINFKRDASRVNNVVKHAEIETATVNTKETRSKAKAVATIKTGLATSKNATSKTALRTALADRKEFQETLMGMPLWRTTFLPTISHLLYVSSSPFDHFRVQSDEFLEHGQTAFNLAFPNYELTLCSGDTIIKTACKRLQNRKSCIGSDILENIQTMFSEGPFKNDAREIVSYCMAALQPGGAAFFAKPTPDGKILPANHPNYKEPEGFLQTELIIKIVRRNLSPAKKSVLFPKISPKNPPIGLYALVMTAIDRAFKAYLPTGTFKQPDDFDQDHYWKAMNSFVRKVASVRESRWKEILGSLNENPNEPDVVMADNDEPNMSVFSSYQDDLFVPGSPTKL